MDDWRLRRQVSGCPRRQRASARAAGVGLGLPRRGGGEGAAPAAGGGLSVPRARDAGGLTLPARRGRGPRLPADASASPRPAPAAPAPDRGEWTDRRPAPSSGPDGPRAALTRRRPRAPCPRTPPRRKGPSVRRTLPEAKTRHPATSFLFGGNRTCIRRSAGLTTCGASDSFDLVSRPGTRNLEPLAA